MTGHIPRRHTDGPALVIGIFLLIAATVMLLGIALCYCYQLGFHAGFILGG